MPSPQKCCVTFQRCYRQLWGKMASPRFPFKWTLDSFSCAILWFFHLEGEDRDVSKKSCQGQTNLVIIRVNLRLLSRSLACLASWSQAYLSYCLYIYPCRLSLCFLKCQTIWQKNLCLDLCISLFLWNVAAEKPAKTIIFTELSQVCWAYLKIGEERH